MEIERRSGIEFLMELPPEAKVTEHKGRFVVACDYREPFMIVGTRPVTIRYIKPWEGE